MIKRSLLVLLLALPLTATATAQAAQVACPMFAKLCPDGSSVSPTGPNCEVPACPGAAPGVPPEDDGAAAAPPLPGQKATIRYLPDQPLEAPTAPQSVKYLVEHRSALDGQKLTVHGVVVALPPPGIEPQRLTIADTAEATRDGKYDVEVTLPLNDKTAYVQGQPLDIPGIVHGNTASVALQKN